MFGQIPPPPPLTVPQDYRNYPLTEKVAFFLWKMKLFHTVS